MSKACALTVVDTQTMTTERGLPQPNCIYIYIPILLCVSGRLSRLDLYLCFRLLIDSVCVVRAKNQKWRPLVNICNLLPRDILNIKSSLENWHTNFQLPACRFVAACILLVRAQQKLKLQKSKESHPKTCARRTKYKNSLLPAHSEAGVFAGAILQYGIHHRYSLWLCDCQPLQACSFFTRLLGPSLTFTDIPGISLTSVVLTHGND